MKWACVVHAHLHELFICVIYTTTPLLTVAFCRRVLPILWLLFDTISSSSFHLSSKTTLPHQYIRYFFFLLLFCFFSLDQILSRLFGLFRMWITGTTGIVTILFSLFALVICRLAWCGASRTSQKKNGKPDDLYLIFSLQLLATVAS